MSNAPKILALREIEPPAALAEALNHDFLAPLKIENPPPVQIMKTEKWGGFCRSHDYTQEGEVVLASSYRACAEVERFRETYLHEISHRFLCGYKEEIGGGHGPVFFGLQLLLFLRAGEREGGHPWAWQANLYDLHDCFGDHPCTPGQALDWAFCQAGELAYTEISAESAADEIARRFAAWRKTLVAAPAKRRAAQARKEKMEEDLARVKNKLFGTRVLLAFSLFFSVALLSSISFLAR